MSASDGGCGCGGSEAQGASAATSTVEAKQGRTPQIRPGLVNRKVTLLMSAGAAIAASCEPCLRKIVPQLKEIGATDEEIHGAIYTGQMVKDRPAAIMKQVADEIAGTSFSETSDAESCPAETLIKDDKYKVTMLVAAAAAMAANCEPCLNRIVPDLIELGVSEADMRKAVEVGQFIKDKPANIMKEAAEALTGAKLSDEPASGGCAPDAAKQSEGAASGGAPSGGSCCG